MRSGPSDSTFLTSASNPTFALSTSGASAWSRFINSASRSLFVPFLINSQYNPDGQQRHLRGKHFKCGLDGLYHSTTWLWDVS